VTDENNATGKFVESMNKSVDRLDIQMVRRLRKKMKVKLHIVMTNVQKATYLILEL